MCVLGIFFATLSIHVARGVLRVFEVLFRRDGDLCSVASSLSLS